MSLPQQLRELKHFKNIFITGEAKVTITKAEHVIIEEVQGTVYIQNAPGTNITIEISAQSVDVKLSGLWHSIEGMEKLFRVEDLVDIEGHSLYDNIPYTYTVPSGKRLVVMGVKAILGYHLLFGSNAIGNRYPTAGFYPHVRCMGDGYELYIDVNDNTVYDIPVTRQKPVVEIMFNVPLTLEAGDELKIEAEASASITYVTIEVYGYEEEV